VASWPELISDPPPRHEGLLWLIPSFESGSPPGGIASVELADGCILLCRVVDIAPGRVVARVLGLDQVWTFDKPGLRRCGVLRSHNHDQFRKVVARQKRLDFVTRREIKGDKR
jgi:hypothetical protein